MLISAAVRMNDDKKRECSQAGVCLWPAYPRSAVENPTLHSSGHCFAGALITTAGVV
jgi:hypothetical protein